MSGTVEMIRFLCVCVFLLGLVVSSLQCLDGASYVMMAISYFLCTDRNVMMLFGLTSDRFRFVFLCSDLSSSFCDNICLSVGTDRNVMMLLGCIIDRI